MSETIHQAPRLFVTGTTMGGCRAAVRHIGTIACPSFDPSKTPFGEEGGWEVIWPLTPLPRPFVIRPKLRTSRIYDIFLDGPSMPAAASEGEFLRKTSGILFVADSQRARSEANVYTLGKLEVTLLKLGRDPSGVPIVFLLNKQDLAETASEAELRDSLGWPVCRHIPTIATTGFGVAMAVESLLGLILP